MIGKGLDSSSTAARSYEEALNICSFMKPLAYRKKIVSERWRGEVKCKRADSLIGTR